MENNYFLTNITSTQNDIVLNKYNNYLQLFNNFIYLNNSLFISFFITNMIDIPICFKNSHSLKRAALNIPVLKFINLLMKKGKKEQITKILFKAFRIFLREFKSDKHLFTLFNKNFLKVFLFLNNFFFHINPDSEEKIDLLYNNNFLLNSKNINNDFFIKNLFLSQISKITPIFSYFIYSVDKNIRKYSRGKSGKYIFI